MPLSTGSIKEISLALLSYFNELLKPNWLFVGIRAGCVILYQMRMYLFSNRMKRCAQKPIKQISHRHTQTKSKHHRQTETITLCEVEPPVGAMLNNRGAIAFKFLLFLCALCALERSEGERARC